MTQIQEERESLSMKGARADQSDGATGAVPKRGSPEWLRLEDEFWSGAHRIVNIWPQPERPLGVLFVLTQAGMKYTVFTVHLAARLKQEGWAVIYLDTPRLANDFTGIAALDQFQNCFTRTQRMVWSINGDSSDKLVHTWSIDWPNRVVEAQGINFYSCFEARLGRIFRCYSVPMDRAKVKDLFRQYVANADKALTIVTEMHERVAKSGFPIRIIGAEPGYVPTGIFATYARAKGWTNNFDFVAVSEGYGNYTRAGRPGLINSLAAARISRPGDRRIPSLPNKRIFDEWLDRCKLARHDVTKVVERTVSQQRGAQGSDAESGSVKADIRKRLTAHRAAGGTVLCLFGKVPYDRAAWEDEGLVHLDMKDWVNDTVRNLTNERVLLLIRPHPSERVAEYFGVPNEYFVDLIETPSDKTLFLDPSLIELNDVVDLLDAGLVWGGTAGIELSAYGLPVIYCSKWTKVDYGLSALHTPRSKEEYYGWLNNPKSLKLSEEARSECAYYIAYVSEGGPTVPFDLAELSEKVKLGGPARWRKHAFDHVDTRTQEVARYLADIVTADAHSVADDSYTRLFAVKPQLPGAEALGGLVRRSMNMIKGMVSYRK